MPNTKRKIRRYSSPLRSEQHQATRDRIVTAIYEEARHGDLAIAQIARRANVSIPTVYRHFPHRASMLQALDEHVHKLVPPPPATDDLHELLRSFFAWRTDVSNKLGPVDGSPLVWEHRRERTVPRRRAFARELIQKRAPNLKEPHRTWLEDLIVVLVSDTTARAFRGYTNLNAEESADRMAWLLESLFDSTRKTSTQKKKLAKGRKQ